MNKKKYMKKKKKKMKKIIKYEEKIYICVLKDNMLNGPIY